MLDLPGLGVSHRGSTTFVSTSIYFHSASWPRIGRPRKSPGWTFSFGSSAWDVEPQWIGPSRGFASREHDIYFHLPFYFHSASWPRIVALWISLAGVAVFLLDRRLGRLRLNIHYRPAPRRF